MLEFASPIAIVIVLAIANIVVGKVAERYYRHRNISTITILDEIKQKFPSRHLSGKHRTTDQKA